MENGQRVAALIPAYNEASTIGRIIQQTAKYVDDVIVVDDASSDDTTTIVGESKAVLIEHSINVGVGGALRTGYRYALDAGYDVIVQIDADGQHDPSYIPALLDASEECDVVIASRYLNESIEEYPILRRLGIGFFTWAVNKLGGLNITDVTSGYRVYHRNALEDIVHESDQHWAVEQTLLAAENGIEIKEHSVEMPVREMGESQFTPARFALYPLLMFDVILRTRLFE